MVRYNFFEITHHERDKKFLISQSIFIILLFLQTIILNNILQNHKRNIKSTESACFHLHSSWYLSCKNIVADYYWLQLLTTENPSVEYLYASADFITDLDLHFNIVYRYGAVLLGIYKKRNDLALKLLEKSLPFSNNSIDPRMHTYLWHFRNKFNKN